MVFPSLVWLLSLKANEINKVDFNSLMKGEKKNLGTIPIVVLSMLFGTQLYRMTQKIAENMNITSELMVKFLYLFITLLGLICLRCIISLYDKKILERKVNIEKETIYVSVDKNTVSNYYKKQSTTKLVILSLIGLVCGFTTVVYSFDLIVVFFIGFLIVTFMNRNYEFPYESSFYKKVH